MKRNLLLIGGGGHCHSVIDSLLSLNLYDNIGVVDSVDNHYRNIPLVGNDDDLSKLKQNGWNEAFVTVGSIGDTSIRRKLFEIIKKNEFIIPSIIDPTAIIAEDTIIAEGTFVGKRAVVNIGVNIGKCAIINTAAVIEHDSTIGDFSHISPGAVICGHCTIGDRAHVGAGTVIRQGLKVGNNALIGIGSVVVNDISDSALAYGNPCRMVR